MDFKKQKSKILNIYKMGNRGALSITIGMANELVGYFGATIIGSVLLEKMIGFELINDVDVAIDLSRLWNIKKFLEDKGFKETESSYQQPGYADTIGSLVFKREGHLPIHVSIKGKDFKLKTIPEIIKEKIDRYSATDRAQILQFVKTNTNNSLWTEKIKK